MLPLSLLRIVSAQHTARHDEDEKADVGNTYTMCKGPS